MLFIPSSLRYTKLQKGKNFNKLKNILSLSKHSIKAIKLISLSNGRLSNKQMVTLRFLIKKSIKKIGFLVFNVFPHTPITKKPSEIRMGKGKGSVSFWASKIKIGITICLIYYKSIFKSKIIKMLKKVQIRLPIKSKIVS